jgi:hypothetical protein
LFIRRDNVQILRTGNDGRLGIHDRRHGERAAHHSDSEPKPRSSAVRVWEMIQECPLEYLLQSLVTYVQQQSYVPVENHLSGAVENRHRRLRLLAKFVASPWLQRHCRSLGSFGDMINIRRQCHRA